MPATNLMPIAATVTVGAEFTLTEPTLLQMVGPAASKPWGMIELRFKTSAGAYNTLLAFTEVQDSGVIPAGTYVPARIRGTVGLERA